MVIQKNESRMATLTGKPFTADYEPAATHGYFIANSRRPLFTPYWIPFMLRDQRVQFALRMIKGPILHSSRFYVDDPKSSGSNHSPLKKFLIKNITNFWRFSSIKALRAVEWGFSANESLYKMRDGQICFDALKIIHPRDGKVLSRHGKLVGISVHNARSARANRVYLGGPKGFWHIVGREESPWYGLSRLFGCFEPWLERTEDGGARDIRRLHYHKYAFTGDVGYFPPGAEPGTTGEFAKSNKALMRSILEKRKTGGVVSFPHILDENGSEKWRIEPGGNATTGGADTIEYNKELKMEIAEGMGIPNEVLEAATVGSGWSGRSIPADAFFSMLQEFVNWLVFDFNQQILLPLVELNFGITDPDYEIIPFGLMQGSGEDEQREKEAQSTDATNQSLIPSDRREASKFAIAV